MTLGSATTLARMILDSCVVSNVRDIDEYVLPADHALIRYRMTKVAHSKPAWDPQRARGRKVSAWPEVHARLMERRGLNWWESSVPALDVIQRCPGPRQLTLRQMDLLHMHNFGFPYSDRRQLDVHLSGDFLQTWFANFVLNCDTSCSHVYGQQMPPCASTGAPAHAVHPFRRQARSC